MDVVLAELIVARWSKWCMALIGRLTVEKIDRLCSYQQLFLKLEPTCQQLDIIWVSTNAVNKCWQESLTLCVRQREWCRKISVITFLPTLWLKGWHSSPSTPLGTHILRPLSQRLTAQQRPNPHCTSLSQACRTERRIKEADEESSFDASDSVLFMLIEIPPFMFESISFLLIVIEMPSHVGTVKAILSIACHLPNPFTNEYQSEDWDNFLSSGLAEEEDVVSCQSFLITFYKWSRIVSSAAQIYIVICTFIVWIWENVIKNQKPKDSGNKNKLHIDILGQIQHTSQCIDRITTETI